MNSLENLWRTSRVGEGFLSISIRKKQHAMNYCKPYFLSLCVTEKGMGGTDGEVFKGFILLLIILIIASNKFI